MRDTTHGSLAANEGKQYRIEIRNVYYCFFIFGGPCNSLVQKMYSFGARPIWVMEGQTDDKQGCKVVDGVLGPFKANKRE